MIRFLQTPSTAKKIVFGVILTAFCVILVITLVPSLSDNAFGARSADPVLATVGSESITSQQATRVAQARLQQQRIPAQFVGMFLPRILDQMIGDKAQVVEAERRGYRVTDVEVRDFLQHGPFAATFFPNGEFIGKEKYDSLLQQNQTTVAEFEKEISEGLLKEKLRAVVTDGVTASDAELQKTYSDQYVKVKVEYALLSVEDLAKSVKPTEPELRSFFESHKMGYQAATPEKRKIEYFVLPAAKISGTQVTEQDAQNYYNAHQTEFSGEEQVKARHILIQVDDSADPKTKDAAKAKAEEALKKAKSGADFAQLAKQYSDDPGSKDNGGELPWFANNGQMVKPFSDAAFALSKGEISGLVKSQFGYHIIKLDDRKPAGTQPFASVKEALLERLKTEKLQDAVRAMATALQAQARSEGLAKAAASRGVQVHTETAAAGASLPDVGPSPEFSEAAFSGPAKAPAQAVELPQGVAVFQVDEVVLAVPPTYESMREKVTNDFKSERAQQMLGQKTAELAEKAKASHDLKSAAKAMGVAVKTSELLARNGQAPDLGSMQGSAGVAFDLKPGEISGPVQVGQKGVVMSVIQRQEPTAEEFTKDKDRVREFVLNRKRQEAMELFIGNLVDEMTKKGKIKRNQAEIDRVSKRAS